MELISETTVATAVEKKELYKPKSAEPALKKKTKPRVAIYGIGGFGLNTTSLTRKAMESMTQVLDSSIAFYLADGSTSDLVHLKEDDELFTIDGIEDKGFGKKRNNEGIQFLVEALPKFLLQHPAGEYNIVVLSTTGGIGSTFGSMVINELLQKEEIVVAIATVGGQDIIQLVNSKNTLLGFNGMAETAGIPFVARLFDNEKDGGEKIVDRAVCETIISLTLLFSNAINSIDYSDVRHFFQYTKVIDVKPSLVTFDLSPDQPPLILDEGLEDPCWAAIGILNNKDDLEKGVTSVYSAIGTVDKDVIGRYDLEAVPINPLWITINSKQAPKIINNITEQIETLKNVQSTMDSSIKKIDMPEGITNDGSAGSCLIF